MSEGQDGVTEGQWKAEADLRGEDTREWAESGFAHAAETWDQAEAESRAEHEAGESRTFSDPQAAVEWLASEAD